MDNAYITRILQMKSRLLKRKQTQDLKRLHLKRSLVRSVLLTKKPASAKVNTAPVPKVRVRKRNNDHQVPITQSHTVNDEVNDHVEHDEVTADDAAASSENVLWKTREPITRELFQQTTFLTRLDANKFMVQCKTCSATLSVLKGNNSNLKSHFKLVSHFKINFQFKCAFD